MSTRVLLMALALVSTTAGGCLGTSPSDPASAGPCDGCPPTSATGEALVVDALELTVGTRYEHHVTWPSSGSELIYGAIVAKDLGDAWLIATDTQQAAINEALGEGSWITLGPFGKDGLEPLQGTGYLTPWYQLPLTNGTTWTEAASYETESFELTYTATYRPDLPTPDGTAPGFEVEAVTENGTPMLRYDYVPALGWFSTFTFLDPSPYEGEPPVEFQIETIEVERNWTGTYLHYQAELLVGHNSRVTLPDADDPTPSPNDVSPSPTASFEVSDGTNLITGFAGSYARAGAHETRLVDPEGTEYRYTVAPAGPDGDLEGETVLLDAVPGTWEVQTAGAGANARGWVWLWGLTDQGGTLT